MVEDTTNMWPYSRGVFLKGDPMKKRKTAYKSVLK